MSHLSTPIGVFDSGIGGLSILKALRLQMPHERFVYFADTAHNPYGEKSEAFVQERTLAVARELVEKHHIKALVVACNTATAAAIHLLRAAFPDLPIVGVEPALKPAALVTRTGRVGVLATRGTLQSAKFSQLRTKLEAEATAAGRSLHFVCTPCDGLAERIERLSEQGRGLVITPDLIALGARFIRATGQFGIENEASEQLDVLVLGCTHYPLIRQVFAQAVGEGVEIVDNALPVAQRTAQLLGISTADASLVMNSTGAASRLVWQSSGSLEGLRKAAQFWLGETLAAG
jgi:glutamate racemase